MTREEIIDMAKKCGWDNPAINMSPLYEFAKLVAEKEREACANVCDDELKKWGIFDSDIGDVSKAIRARGNHD